MGNLVTEVSWEDRRPGDVGVLHGAGIISNSIILGEKLAHEVTDFAPSHAFIVGTGYILEAIWPRISMSRFDIYNGQPTRLFRFDFPVEKKLAALLAIQHEWVGKGYNLSAVVDLGAVELLRHLGVQPKLNVLDNRHKAFCSELATRYVNLLGVTFSRPAESLNDPALFYDELYKLAHPVKFQSTLGPLTIQGGSFQGGPLATRGVSNAG